MTDGFIQDSYKAATTVTGFVYSDYNVSLGGLSPSRESSWDARVPSFGAVYTPKGFDRSRMKFLKDVPVVLPNYEGMEQIFLTAQGEASIGAKAWGLQLHYECSIVNKLSDMQLLKERKSSMEVWAMKDVQVEFEEGNPKATWEELLLKASTPTPTETETKSEYPLDETVALATLKLWLTFQRLNQYPQTLRELLPTSRCCLPSHLGTEPFPWTILHPHPHLPSSITMTSIE